jgi:predicted small lipoprotein YifL
MAGFSTHCRGECKRTSCPRGDKDMLFALGFRRMRTVKPVFMLVLLFAFTAGGLAACGQKGDLYLPGKPDRQQDQQR